MFNTFKIACKLQLTLCILCFALSNVFTVNAQDNRVTEDLLVYYTFSEAGGDRVLDTSGFSNPLHLDIIGDGYQWLPNRNGLKALDSIVVSSSTAASKLVDNITAESGFSVEIWCKSDDLSQAGPARMVSYSIDPANRNFTVAQLVDSISIRLRTTETSLNGHPDFDTGQLISAAESHFVFTFSTTGILRLYKDGALISSETRDGDFSNWDPSYPLLLFNEASGDRPWLGEIYLVAIYGRDLSQSEILQNFESGPGPITTSNTLPQAPPLLSPAANRFVGETEKPLTFSWQVPVDADQDSLHFILEIATDSSFSTIERSFNSAIDDFGFMPTPPVQQSTDSASFDFDIDIDITDNSYWWRVSAIDGEGTGPASVKRRFTLDTIAPNIDSLIADPPHALPNWYNQNLLDSIAFTVQYDELFMRNLVFDAEALDAPVVAGIPPSGTDQRVRIPLFVQDAVDGVYGITVILTDSAKRESGTAMNIALDRTPPQGTVALSPHVSNTETFSLDWQNSGSDSSGSGLSGSYDVKVRVNDQDWQDWLSGYTGTQSNYNGQHGNTYAFEVAAYDRVGNRELFSGIPETMTVVDSTSNDVSAPPPPVNLVADNSNPSPWQNIPVFEISWQAPFDPSGIASTYFKLGDPPAADFDTTGSRASAIQMSVNATAEDGQQLHIWFSDNKGNIDYRNRGTVMLRYDKTAPVIDGIDFLNAALAPSWFNPAQTDTAQLNVTYSEKHTAEIVLSSPVLQIAQSVSTPQSGSEVTGEIDFLIKDMPDGEYSLAVTVSDTATNSTQDSITIALDQTPPEGTIASSGDSSTTLDFRVSWQGTGQDTGSGLSGLYDVLVRINGGIWQPWLSEFQGTDALFSGDDKTAYSFEAAAYDWLGNREIVSGTAETSTIIDTAVTRIIVPISITNNTPSVADPGQAITFQFSTADNVDIDEALLFYTGGGLTVFEVITMQSGAERIWSATLPADQVNRAGIKYYYRLSNSNSIVFEPTDWQSEPHYIAVRISGNADQGLVRELPQPAGQQAAAYRMISVPLQLDDADPLAVLADDLGDYDPEQWRLFQYRKGRYSEYPEVDAFEPGNALWLIVKTAGQQIDSGVGTSYAANRPFEIILQQGWNDFSNPFGFGVDWAAVDHPDNIPGVYTFRDGWILPGDVTRLEPWEGYSVYSPTAGDTLRIHPVAAGTSVIAQPVFQTSEWYIQISADSPHAHDRNNYLGFAKGANEKQDGLDLPEPPSPGNYISLQFPHDNWPGPARNFTTDFRPVSGQGEVWDFEVNSNLEQESVTLSFNLSTNIPPGFNVVLNDLSGKQSINILDQPSYSFTIYNAQQERSFRLLIGTQAFLEENHDQKAGIPESHSISQNFPNPFNSGTTFVYKIAEPGLVSIEIVNIRGQLIRQLIHQEHLPGSYRIHWDGLSEQSEEASSGVYFVRFKANDFIQNKKLLLIR